MFAKEIAATALFVLGFLVLPEVLRVNRRPAWWAWLALLPLLRCRMPDQGTYTPSIAAVAWRSIVAFCHVDRSIGGHSPQKIPPGPTFAPSLLYSLWFASRGQVLDRGIDTIQYEHGTEDQIF